MKGPKSPKIAMKLFSSFRKYRKYKSASIFFARPYVDQYMQDFQQAIGTKFQKCVKHYSVIKCCIMPVQSTAFSLGHDQALAKLYVSQLGREKNTEELLKDIGTERTLCRARALLSARFYERTVYWAHASLSARIFERALNRAHALSSARVTERTLYPAHALPSARFIERKALPSARFIERTPDLFFCI